jgi:hypothetical protein
VIKSLIALIMAVAVATTSTSMFASTVYGQQQLQRSMITGTASPTAAGIIEAVQAECAKLTPEAESLSILCVSMLYESDRTIVLKGNLLIIQSGMGYIDNPFIWQAVDEFKVQGYVVDSVLLGGQGSRGNPHQYYIAMSK